MRVLHVITTGDRRGAEMFAADLIPCLTRAGIDQRVAVLRGSEPLSAAYAARTHILADRRIDRVPGLRMDPRVAGRLRSLCRTWQPDIVQAHGGEPFKYAALTAPRRTRVVYRRIGLSPDHASRGPVGRAYRTLMRRCHRIVAVAEAVREETIVEFGVRADRVITIPRGVDPDRVRSRLGRSAARRRLGLPPERAVVLSLGALSTEKDPMAHLAVMEQVRAAVPGSIHLIAGDGPLRAAVEARVRDAGLDGTARVLGNRTDVAELLAATDVMLLASRSEGMPGCLIEAGIAGLPVVAYAVAGVPEIVVNGSTGYTVPPGDLQGLVDRTVALLGEPELRRRVGEEARRRCEETFDIRLIAGRYLSMYEEVLD